MSNLRSQISDPVDDQRYWKAKAFVIVLIGFAAGVLSGLMGVGGGVLLVPAMVFLLGFTQHRAHGTSLAVIIPIVGMSALAYCLHGNIYWAVAAELAIGGVVGATIGAKLAQRIPAKRLKRLFAVFLLIVAAKMLYDATHSAHVTHLPVQNIPALVILTGLAAGLLSGIMGVGGGIIMIPAMVYLLHMQQITAQGISLLVIIPVSISGAIAHLAKGNVDLRYGKWLAIGGVGGSMLGANLAHQWNDLTLRIIFGAFLMLIAGLTLRSR